MRRLLTWLGLAAGALVVFRRFRRSKPEAAAADPAEELKQKLAESRAEEPEPAAAAEPEPEPPAAPVDERRRAVHDKARAAMDDMLGGEGLPGEESD
jgi:hypothetical protein